MSSIIAMLHRKPKRDQKRADFTKNVLYIYIYMYMGTLSPSVLFLVWVLHFLLDQSLPLP